MIPRPSRIAALVAAAALTLPISAVAAPAAGAAEATAVVTGTVANPEGEPIANAEVSVVPEAGGMSLSATTDADGRFTTAAVEPGRYVVQARDSGNFLAGESNYRSEVWNGTTSAPGWTAVDLPAGTTTTTFELDHLIGIVAKAVDAQTGEPLPNIGWTARTLDPATGQWKSLGRSAQPTFPTGKVFYPTNDGQVVKFCFLDVYYPDGWTPPFRYRTACWDGETSFEEATPITTTASGRKLEITIPMERAGLSLTQGRPVTHGTPAAGGELTVEPGAWGPEPVTLSYQWEYASGDGGLTPIAGATGRTFVPRAEDAGRTLFATVTGSKPGHASSSTSVNAGIIGGRTPTLSSLTLTGSNTAGSVLTATPGSVTPSGASIDYSWYVDGGLVAGATGASFTVTPATAGKAISVLAEVSAWGQGEPAYTNSLRVLRTMPGVTSAAAPTSSSAPATTPPDDRT